jgi:hypothetical protein
MVAFLGRVLGGKLPAGTITEAAQGVKGSRLSKHADLRSYSRKWSWAMSTARRGDKFTLKQGNLGRQIADIDY